MYLNVVLAQTQSLKLTSKTVLKKETLSFTAGTFWNVIIYNKTSSE